MKKREKLLAISICAYEPTNEGPLGWNHGYMNFEKY